MAAEVIMVIVLFLLAWTYLLYPATVFALANIKNRRGGNSPGQQASDDRPLPTVSVIMSVHNEEKVIEEKVRSLTASDYPHNLAEFLMGSDASDDDTGQILQDLSAGDCRIRFFRYEARRGKPAVLNDLVTEARGEILVITDANVIFSPDTLRQLAECVSVPGTGLCDATVVPRKSDESGITRQENYYSRFETALKRAEGILSHNVPGAKVYEDTQPGMAEQFRRRIRIAAGSFQNLFRFGPFPSRKIHASFAFFSHKVLRWLTPLFLILFFMTTVILSGHSLFYFCLSAIQLIFIILSALDLALDRYGRKIRYQRYVTQFLMMNAALVAGFARAAGGIKSGIWEPTKRVQDD
jgi:cellulose synthase/poly-beta-1,6-N-acetylglucosamine synthase-like glycosyltransferase